MEHKWQFSTHLHINTRRKNPRPHSIIVTFRTAVPELWNERIRSSLSNTPPCNVDPTVPDQVAEIIRRTVQESGVSCSISVDKVPTKGQFIYFNAITGRVQFPVGTPLKKVRAFDTKLRAEVDQFFVESDIPYYPGELEG
jgi:hypothetical protein